MRTFPASEAGEVFWREAAILRAETPNYASPFFDPGFAREVASVRSDVRIVIAEDAGGLAAFWPMHVRPGRWARPIGGPFSNWHGPVCRRGAGPDPGDLLSGAGLAGFTCHGFHAPGRAPPGLAADAMRLSDLSGGWPGFHAACRALRPKHFKKLRRLRRNLEREHGEIEFRDDDADEAAFNRLITLKRERFRETARHDVLAPDWARRLLDRLRGGRFEDLRARLSTLRVGRELAAAEFNLESAHVRHGWIAAIDRRFAKYSPGHLLMESMLQAMSETGPALYDAGPGEETHKTLFSNAEIELGAGVVRGAGAVRSPSRLLGAGWRAAERAAPGAAQSAMGRLRRRADQIAASELDAGRRAAAFLRAFAAART